MTEGQLRVLDFIRERISNTSFAPTIREIAAEIGSGVGVAHQHVTALIELGKLRRQPHRTRGLELIDRPDLRVVTSGALRAELARRGETLEALAATDSLAYGTKRSCAADSCGAEVRVGQLFCRTHWFRLPPRLQDGIRQAFSHRDTARYQALVGEARDIADGGAPWRRQA